MDIEQLKERMTEEQRRDMAEIVANEVRRREGMKRQANSGARPAARSNVKSARMGAGMDADAMGEVYSEIKDKVRQLREQQIDQQILEARKMSSKLPLARWAGMPKLRLGSPQIWLVLGVFCFGLAKVYLASGGDSPQTKAESPAGAVAAALPAIESSDPANLSSPELTAPQPEANGLAAVAPVMPETDRRVFGWSAAEKQVLTELDARRVELEKRRQDLDQREAEVRSQSAALAERIAELKTLTTKVSQVRKEKDNQFEARLEQLASVYSSMAPNEAAPLVARLDEETALGLLKRMPGKRMGQILSAMDTERAVAITKILSDPKRLGALPAVDERSAH